MPDINLSQKTNLLEQDPYSYELQDVKKPALFHEMFPYNETPKIAFNYRRVPQNMPDNIFITDTTFRDGQQSRTPYTTEQMIHLYKLLHKLGGDNGMIRQTEFFVYSKKTVMPWKNVWNSVIVFRKLPLGFGHRKKILSWCARSE